MDVWKKEILKAINLRGGVASYDNICEDLRGFYQSREKTKYGLRQIKLHIKYLLQFGDIREVSTQVYSLRDEGKRRLSENDYKWHYSDRNIDDIPDV